MAIDQADRGTQLAAISNAVTKIHRDSYGRGARRTRTIMQGDYVVAFMEDIYTPVEKTFIAAGKFEQVRKTRLTFQELMRDQFAQAVEAATGRRVIAFFSQVHSEPDMSLEGFVLEPLPDARPEIIGSENGDQPG